jgi:hypothetical protein
MRQAGLFHSDEEILLAPYFSEFSGSGFARTGKLTFISGGGMASRRRDAKMKRPWRDRFDHGQRQKDMLYWNQPLRPPSWQNMYVWRGTTTNWE